MAKATKNYLKLPIDAAKTSKNLKLPLQKLLKTIDFSALCNRGFKVAERKKKAIYLDRAKGRNGRAPAGNGKRPSRCARVRRRGDGCHARVSRSAHSYVS